MNNITTYYGRVNMKAIQLAIAAQQQQSTGSSAQDLRDELKAIREVQDLMKNRRR